MDEEAGTDDSCGCLTDCDTLQFTFTEKEIPMVAKDECGSYVSILEVLATSSRLESFMVDLYKSMRNGRKRIQRLMWIIFKIQTRAF